MFLNIGSGLLSVMFVSSIFHVPLTTPMTVVGILFALGPDLDYLYHILRHGHGKSDFEHRNLLHLPLLYLPVGTAIIFLVAGPMYATLFLIPSLLHFFHDSMGIGWGVRWLFPLSTDNIAFFYLYSGKIPEGLRKLIFVFDTATLRETVHEHGDPDWKQNIYGKLHPIAIIEYSVFIISLIILFLYVR